MDKIELVSYIPEVATYKICYPEHYLLNDEDESGIVSITSPDGLNMTISSYSASVDMTEDVLLSFFKDMTEDYQYTSELKCSVTGNYLSCEQHFKKEDNHWIWWMYVKANQIIAISVNSDRILTKDEYNLFRFMADNMEIFSAKEQ
jgi:hypothetical protein